VAVDAWTVVGAVASIAGALASAAGAVATIAIAVFVYRWQQTEQAQRESAVRAERRQQLLTAVRQNVMDNRERVAQIQAVLPQQIVFQNLDLSILDSTASLKYEVLDDIDFCRRLDSLRAESRQAYTQLDQLRNVDFDGTLRSLTLNINDQNVSAYGHMRHALVASLTDHLARLREQCDQLLAHWPAVTAQPQPTEPQRQTRWWRIWPR
jgi:hypothetical protein